MGVLATDTFTRANGASLGANWTVAKGVTEELGILTNQAEHVTAGSTGGNYYSAVAAPNDQYSQAVVVALLNYWQGVTVRSITSGASRNAYVAGQDFGDFGGANTNSRVWKEVAGVVTSLGTGATPLAAGQTWYLEVKGTALVMKINGTQEISASDSALTAGQFGLQSFNTGTGGIAVFDTWEGGDFAVAASAAIGPFLGRGPGIGPMGLRRASAQRFPDTTAPTVELTQSPAAPFRPGRGPGKGPMLLRRNLVWPSAVFTPDVTLALTGVQATGSVGTLGVQHDQALTGNAATGAVGSLAASTDVALTGVAATGSVGALAPSTAVALTGVAGTGSVGTLAPSTTVTLTGNEATVTIGTLTPSVSGADVTIALTGVSASALIGDLSPSGGDVPADTTELGGRRVRKARKPERQRAPIYRHPEEIERERRMLEEYLESLETKARPASEEPVRPGESQEAPTRRAEPVSPRLSDVMARLASAQQLALIERAERAANEDKAKAKKEHQRRRVAAIAVLMMGH